MHFMETDILILVLDSLGNIHTPICVSLAPAKSHHVTQTPNKHPQKQH